MDELQWCLLPMNQCNSVLERPGNPGRHMPVQVERAKPGKSPGKDAADGQDRKVCQHGRKLGDGYGHRNLPQVMGQCPKYADENHISIPEDAKQQRHGKEAAKTSRKAVHQGYHLSGEKRRQEYPGKEDGQGILCLRVHQEPEGDDVGKPQFDALKGKQGRQERFRREDGQGNGGVQRQQGVRYKNIHEKDKTQLTKLRLSW